MTWTLVRFVLLVDLIQTVACSGAFGQWMESAAEVKSSRDRVIQRVSDVDVACAVYRYSCGIVELRDVCRAIGAAHAGDRRAANSVQRSGNRDLLDSPAGFMHCLVLDL